MMGKKMKSVRLQKDELSAFCEQTALLLNSGITVYDGIYMIFSEADEGRYKDVLKDLSDRLGNYVSLGKAMEESGAFPEYMTHMVSIGESSGMLEEVLKSLASFYAREYRLSTEIKGAVVYPLILFAALTGIMSVLAWKILPLFESMFDELSSDVSADTFAAVHSGLIVGRVVAVILCVILLTVLIGMLMVRTSGGNRIVIGFLSHFGFVKRLSELMATEKVVSSLSLMQSSGMDIVDGLEREASECTNPRVSERISVCAKLYSDNASLADAINESGLIKGMESRMLSVAAKTGESDDMLKKLAASYDTKVAGNLSRLTTVTETTLVITLSAVVAAVLAIVMVPLINLISVIG